MKKIVVFSGAGVSKESGVLTFRDVKDGLWNNHKIEDVATIEGWKKDPAKVLAFYNERRQQMPTVEPNDAHFALKGLEQEYDVTIVTQNVDDLHERAGSSKILHLHGELTKAKSSYGTGNRILDNHDSVDIGYNDINIGDMCEEFKAQMRPDIVWFGEYPYQVDRAYQAIGKADILLIVGTSLQIGYTLDMLQNVKKDCKIIYIDPQPMHYLDSYGMTVEYITKNAIEGVGEIVNRLLVQENSYDKNVD
jgi:NAD-dependent deacetylase